MAAARAGLQSIALLVFALAGSAPAAVPGQWMQVVRQGQEVPGTGGIVVSIDASIGGRVLRVGADGQVWMTGLYGQDSWHRPFGLVHWSPERGLSELLPIGTSWDGAPGLTADGLWLLDIDGSGRAAVGVWSSGGACPIPVPSAVWVDGEGLITTVADCTDLAAFLPGDASSEGFRSMGWTDVGELALDLFYNEDHNALLTPDGAGGLTVAVRTRDPAPGDPLREFAYAGPGLWRAGRLAFTSYLAQDRMAQVPAPGDGDAIYLWDPTHGFSLIARAEEEPSIEPWSILSDLQVSDAGYMVWSAWGEIGREARTALFGSDGGAPELLLADDGPLPGAPDSKSFAFLPGEMLVMEPDGVAVHVEVETEDEDYYEALVTRTPGGAMAMRLRSGQLIPASGGLSYEQFEPIAASPDGRLVFLTWTSRGSAYALLEPDGSSYLLRQFLPGDEVECAPGDVGTVAYADVVTFDRELRFMAQFVQVASKCTAIYVTTVPEPYTALQGVAALALLSLARRSSEAAR